jgi:cellulose synthase/poly-beta-1,6-N-acetylglucosamine synthase-like glycosyltransferase
LIFWKIDTEGYGCHLPDEYLEKFEKYIQFEYTSAWLSHDKKLLMTFITGYLILLISTYLKMMTSISLLYPKDMTEVTEDLFIDSYMTDGYGFNIAPIQRY